MMEPMTLLILQLNTTCIIDGCRRKFLPDTCANHDGRLPTKHIGEKTGEQSRDPGSSGHGSGDAALYAGCRTSALVLRSGRGTLVEVAFILRCADDGRHGRNVETGFG